MDTKKRLLASLAVGAGLAFVARKLFAASAMAAPLRARTSYDEIDGYIERKMRGLKVPGVSLAIVEGDQIVHARGFGRARPGGEVPSPQTPFFIGSLTKSITALAMMQLVEAGKVELDAPVQRCLPWFRVADPEASAEMTVRHLLNQTSGLPESSGEIAPVEVDVFPKAAEQRARALASIDLRRPVGAACEYSNMNYDLLGLIVEAASGRSYADYLQDHIFSPLKMSRTYTSRAEARQNGLAMGHRYWFGIPVAAPNLPMAEGSLPSGGLISTAEDLARYLIAHLNGGRKGDASVLSSSFLDELHRGVVEYSQMGISAGRYAMGWFDSEIGKRRVVWHGGTMPDFGAYMAFLPEQGKAIVLLFNACHWWFTPVWAEVGMGAVALLAGEEFRPTPFLSVIPWILRGQLLIPALQAVEVASTLSLLRRWRRDPSDRKRGGREWKKHVMLPLIPNLLVALSLRSVLGRRRAYLKLFMPDYSWIATVCGSFSVVWSCLRTGLVLRALRKGSPSPSFSGRPVAGNET